jgi:lactoylglutathione lyase
MGTNSNTEDNVKQAVPFFAVTHMAESVRFYVEGLGFKITKRWDPEGTLRWCWLELGAAAIMLQTFLTEGHDAWKPQGKLGEGVTIFFQCTDALAIYREITRRGIQASKPFVGNGMWVTSLADPDGYKLEFESPTDQPEDTEYKEPEG